MVRNKFTRLLALAILSFLMAACLICLDSFWLAIKEKDAIVSILFHGVLTPATIVILLYSLFTTQTMLEYITGRTAEDTIHYKHLMVLFYIVLLDFVFTALLLGVSVSRNAFAWAFSGKQAVPWPFVLVSTLMLSLEAAALWIIYDLHPDLFGRKLHRDILDYKRELEASNAVSAAEAPALD